MNINEMTLTELNAGLESATALRKHYEDKIVLYRGLEYLTMRETTELDTMTQKLATINSVRLNLLAEIERRLLDIDFDYEPTEED